MIEPKPSPNEPNRNPSEQEAPLKNEPTPERAHEEKKRQEEAAKKTR